MEMIEEMREDILELFEGDMIETTDEEVIEVLEEMDKEGLVYELLSEGMVFTKQWWESPKGSMRQSRAWMKTEYGKIYFDE